MKIKVIVLILLSLTLVGCANNIPYSMESTHELVGFWYGLWHGFIYPISFLVSLFDDSVSIYAVYNNGSWYDFGFLLGAGGLGFSSNK